MRLLLPFFVGIFVFLMPRLYLGQPYEDWARPTDPRSGEHLMENDFDWFDMVLKVPDVRAHYPSLFWDLRAHSFRA